ncbi:MAG: galactokinase family protein [Thermoflexaceae bacterium]|nr:galactokinase family protein [Thermoflexaceae bacterium]
MRKLGELMKELETGKWDGLLLNIYEDSTLIPYQRERYINLLKLYEKTFKTDDVAVYSAPGRSEVCGNHTDHQKGEVLATSINLDAIAVVSKNNEDVIRLVSDGYPMITVDLKDISKKKEDKGSSAGLIKGVVAGLVDAGYKAGGFNAYVTSDVLIGAGLSSSAAFETIIGTIISGLFNDMAISSVKIAQVGQYAENEYFGKPCGLMDQMACSVGGLIHIDFRDTANPVVNKVNVDFSKYAHSLCIVDTKGSHQDLTDDYAAVPKEMKAVAACFGKEVLREVDEKDFYANIADIRKKTNDRAVLRAIHFFEEEKRVEKIVEHLNEGDFETFLQLITQSGNSSFKYLQNVYTSKDVANQGVSVGLAASETALMGKGATRVHGGGFAGTIQAFVPDEQVKEYRRFMDNVFGAGSCHVLKVRKYGGMKVME